MIAVTCTFGSVFFTVFYFDEQVLHDRDSCSLRRLVLGRNNLGYVEYLTLCLPRDSENLTEEVLS